VPWSSAFPEFRVDITISIIDARGEPMTATFEALGLGHLTPPERLDFANKLLAEAETSQGVSPSAKLAYVRRLQEEARANPDDRVPWEEVYAQLLREFPE
jgi:hypothetical protein